jgi:DNA-binding IclR family transcriptional regulator
MRDLVHEVRNTVVLSVWGGRAPVVARVVPDTSRVTTISVEVGRSLSPETAQARVFAAHRRRSRRAGAAPEGGLRAVEEDDGLVEVGGVPTARQSFDGGVKTVAAPVYASDGSVVATLAVIGLAMHLPDHDDDAVAERLVAAASRIPAT